MKTFIKILVASLIMIISMPSLVLGQTKDNHWVSLGDYIQGKYKKKGKYLIPEYQGSFLYVTKLAYRTPDDAIILPKSDIIINKLSHVENHGVPVFEKNNPIIVNELFEILMNGKPISGYEVTDDGEGWKIIDLNGVGSITSVLMKKKSKTQNNDIFDHIFVTLDSLQDPHKIKEEILKAKEEKERKINEFKNSNSDDSVLPIIR